MTEAGGGAADADSAVKADTVVGVAATTTGRRSLGAAALKGTAVGEDAGTRKEVAPQDESGGPLLGPLGIAEDNGRSIEVIDIPDDDIEDETPTSEPLGRRLECHMTSFDWRGYGDNRLLTFSMLKKFKKEDASLHGTMRRKEQRLAREMLDRLGAGDTRARVLELEQFRDGYYSDDTAMHAYALYHMAMIPWWQAVQVATLQSVHGYEHGLTCDLASPVRRPRVVGHPAIGDVRPESSIPGFREEAVDPLSTSVFRSGVTQQASDFSSDGGSSEEGSLEPPMKRLRRGARPTPPPSRRSRRLVASARKSGAPAEEPVAEFGE